MCAFSIHQIPRARIENSDSSVYKHTDPTTRLTVPMIHTLKTGNF